MFNKIIIRTQSKVLKEEQGGNLLWLDKNVISLYPLVCYAVLIVLSITVFMQGLTNQMQFYHVAQTYLNIIIVIILVFFLIIPFMCYRSHRIKFLKICNLLREKEKLSESYISVFNSQLESIGLIDDKGNIVFINRSWEEFFEENGLNKLSYKKGDNLFDLMNKVSDANKFRINILSEMLKEIINGQKNTFSVDYPLLINHQTRWFRFQAIRDDNKNAGIVIQHKEISERKEEELKHEFERNNLYALINNTNDLVWSVDKSLNLISSNEPFNKIIKIMSGNVINHGESVLVDGFEKETLENWRGFYDRALKGEIFTITEYVKVPIEIWSEISFYPIKKGDDIIGTACHSRDITQRMEKERELKHLIDMAENQNKRLQNFAYIVSHNIRSHSVNILSLVDSLEKADMNDDKSRLIQMLHTSTHKLGETIENLNYIVTIQNHTNQAKTIVNLKQEIDKTADAINHVISQTNTNLINQVPEDVTIEVVPSYLDSILLNLLTNAIKYSAKERKPEIKVFIQHNKDYIMLFVRDNGQGIDLEKNGNKLFGMYKTFHHNKDARGLGLFITKNQIEAMNGKIEVESQLGVGSTFKIYFNNAKN